MFMGPCIVSIFQYISNKMQRYTVYLYLETALHVSGGTTIHHQERIQLYLQHLLFVTPLAIMVWQIPDVVDTVVCAPDDGWRYHPKRVEQFPDVNKLCKVASCWIYIEILSQYLLHVLVSTPRAHPRGVPWCTMHIDIYYTIPVLVTTVYLLKWALGFETCTCRSYCEKLNLTEVHFVGLHYHIYDYITMHDTNNIKKLY